MKKLIATFLLFFCTLSVVSMSFDSHHFELGHSSENHSSFGLSSHSDHRDAIEIGFNAPCKNPSHKHEGDETHPCHFGHCSHLISTGLNYSVVQASPQKLVRRYQVELSLQVYKNLFRPPIAA